MFGAIGGFGLLAYGVIRRMRQIERAGLVVLILSVLVAIPVFLTGEGAEETVENLPGSSEAAVEQHEEIATASFYGMLAMGAVTLIAWFNRSFGKAAGPIRWFSVLSAFVMACTLSVTAWYGGKAAHQEVRGDSVWDLFRAGTGLEGATPDAGESGENGHED